ncbi:UPF0496 protein At3g49070 isoform X2 [Humulus lupulus]|uniref:UPF0496 protein At3g49070 isoform X2 n=1 Tax=Humulus lupulus TaxID=3486 RepID=UPI002B414D8A|nr:UPF0496 protein At3g49070 isoform X2 [Humulus lupulus]
MKNKISSHIRKFIPCSANTSPNHSIDIDVREEYANAFRTESYIDFWTRVIAISNADYATAIPAESTSSARLPSYRLFMEHLLDPDQPTVTHILSSAHNRPKIHALLSEYFTQTANASILCGILLNDIEKTRGKYRYLKTSIQSVGGGSHTISNQLTEFSCSINPFTSPISSPSRVRIVQTGCSGLLHRLEVSRDKARAKLQLINKLKHGSAVVLVALMASLSVIVVTHALSLVVAIPSLISASIELASSRKLARMTAQLDAAAKGTYILNRDLDIISRLVARLNDELEHLRGVVQFWIKRGGQDWLKVSSEVAHQLKKNESSINEQLDELEEHLYLCFMTINRARSLVVKEMFNPGQPTKHHCILLSN